uniref:UTP6 small subunit processome component n=1 Tax=Oncorhynchus kisutch TaxID=8019 RepID=A0A8C7MIZ7_ONCKI
MAEIVQQRMENRIPELEQLEKVGLFSKKEVKSLLKLATALEYKLHRLIITKVYFIAYIQYEINVLELIKKRRSRIGYQFKREEIKFSIISRINNIFRRATTKWKDDVQLWLSHIAFCKKWVSLRYLGKVFSSMLRNQVDLSSLYYALWIMAAKSELEDRNSSESARHLFLRALLFHPESKKVYQELLHAEKLRKQQKELEQAEIDVGGYEFSPEIVSGKLAEVVYRDATGKIQGADFILSLLTIAAIFDFTKDLQDTIIQDLQSKYTYDSLTWDFMARRELEATVGEELQTAKGRASDIARREERCCQVYEQGLNSLNTEAMWACYVSFCLERFKRKTDIRELKETVNISNHDHHFVTVCFFLCSQRGLLSVVPAVSMEIKEKYLDWSYRAGGYKKARKTFTSLHESRPFSKAFFNRMIQMEKDQVSRDCLYGFFPPDLWLEYIREELGPRGQPESCGMIHWRAMKMLEGESVERFTAQYTLLQTGHI